MRFTVWFKQNWMSVIIALMPLAILAVFWNQLPDMVPGHYNIEGEVDRYDPKGSLFFIPLLTLFIMGIFWVLPMIDPKKNMAKFQKSINQITLIFALFMLGIFSVIVFSAMGYDLDVGSYVITGVLLLFIFIGNMFGKLRPNYFMGIRTPWTLESETNWIKTHRMSGYFWVGGSLLMLVLKFFMSTKAFFIPFFIFGISIAIVPFAYSYWLYKNEPETE